MGLRYIDDLILRDCDNYTPSRLYATHDQWHVIATVDDGGEATERYAYRAFGDTQALTPAFAPRLVSVTGWETTYGAYRFDSESKLFCVRSRHLHSASGRWLKRDPLSDAGGDHDLFAYVRNRPIQTVDPSGAGVQGAVQGYCKNGVKHFTYDPLPAERDFKTCTDRAATNFRNDHQRFCTCCRGDTLISLQPVEEFNKCRNRRNNEFWDAICDCYVSCTIDDGIFHASGRGHLDRSSRQGHRGIGCSGAVITR